MGDDYCSAAGKHLDDAQLLFQNERFDNAAYLSGYVLECALKLLVEHSGGQPRRYGHDLSQLSGHALDLAYLLSPSLRRYSLPATQEVRLLRENWKPSLRYQGRDSVARADAKSWCDGAGQVYRAIVVRYLLDGGRCTP